MSEFVVEDCLEWGYDLFAIQLVYSYNRRVVKLKNGHHGGGGFHVKKNVRRPRRCRKVKLWEEVTFRHRVVFLMPL